MAIVVVVVSLAVGLTLWNRDRTPPPDATVAALPALTEPPTVDLTDADPAIVALVKSAESGVRQSPGSSAAWGRLGMVLMAHRFTEAAEICLGQAERLDPREPRWPYYRGDMLVSEDLDAAIPPLNRAARLAAPAVDAPRLLLADTLVIRGRLDEGAQEYRTLLAADPANARAHLGLARVAYARNDFAEAASQLRSSALTAITTRKAAGSLMASILRRQGDTSGADRELQRAAALPPDAGWPDPYGEQIGQLQTGRKASTDRARQLYDQGLKKEAIDLLRRTVRDYPRSDVAWLMLGQALIGEDDWNGAEQALRAAVREAPESDENLQYLGMALAGKHDDAGAIACLRKAVDLRPDNAEAQVLLGQSLKRQHDGAGAIRAFRTAIRYHPQVEDAHLLLAESLSEQGNTADALAQVREVLQLNPANPKAKALLARLEPRR